MFGATQMPFYGKNNYYSPQTMYFRLLGRPFLGRPLLGRQSFSSETRPTSFFFTVILLLISATYASGSSHKTIMYWIIHMF